MKKKKARNIVAYFKQKASAYCFYNAFLWCIIRIKKILLRFLQMSSTHNYSMLSEEQAYEVITAVRPDTSRQEGRLSNQYNDDIFVSIIVPIYNAEKYLEECLESLKNQDTMYKYEVICVNDGSTDCSGEILEKYRDVDYFRVITQDNRGYSGARNTGLSVSLGKYVMFVDADDFISIDYVNQLAICAVKTQADIVVSSYQKCNMNGKILKKYYYSQEHYANFFDYAVFDGVAWGKLYKSSLWDMVRFPENMMFEDTIILNVIFRRCKKVAVCAQGYYFYRIHGNNTIDRLADSPMLLDAVWVVRKALETSSELGLKNTEDYFGYLLLQCSTHMLYRIENFSEDIQRAVFKLTCSCVNEYCRKLREHEWHFNDIVLDKLRVCFETEDFQLWKRCSKVYPSNHIRICKGIRRKNEESTGGN